MSVFDGGAVPFSAIPAREIPWNQGYRFANRCFLAGHGNFSDSLLGYRIIRSRGTSGKMVPKVLVPKKAVKQFRVKVRQILAPNTTKESIGYTIQRLNWLTRGWCEYYRCTSSPSWAFRHIDAELYWDFAHWLGQKYEIKHMSGIMRRFHKGKTFGNKTLKLVKPSEYTAKRLIARFAHFQSGS